MNVIAARILPFLFITASILPAENLVDINGLVGKHATWDLDENLDEFIDGSVTVENIQKVEDPLDPSGHVLRCTLIVTSGINDSEILLTNANFSWMDVAFFKEEIESEDDFQIGIYAGVVRKYVVDTISIDNTTFDVSYDRSTGLLLAIYVEHGSTTYSENRTHLLRISSTDVFFNMWDAEPYLIGIGIAIGAIGVLFTIAALAIDHKKRSNRACFDAECWE